MPDPLTPSEWADHLTRAPERLAQDLAELQAAIDAVRALHQRHSRCGDCCVICDHSAGWPCPTVRALPPEGPAT